MSFPVKIIVDVHEDDSGIAQSLKKAEMPVIQRHIETGDVVLDNKGYMVGIEIKRFNDFQNSLYSGRLHDQLCRLHEAYDYPVLVIEGFEGDLEWFWKATNTLNLRQPTYVTDSQLATVDLISEFVRLLAERKFNVLRRPIILEEKVPPQIIVLCALPYVSRAMAEELMEKYGSLTIALKCVDEWTEIKRLTDKRVVKIKEVLSKEYDGMQYSQDGDGYG